jgi:hypothetical protein
VFIFTPRNFGLNPPACVKKYLSQKTLEICNTQTESGAVPFYSKGEKNMENMDKKELIEEITKLLTVLDTSIVRATYITLKKFKEAIHGRD